MLRTLQSGVYLSEIPGLVNPAVDGVKVPVPDPSIHRMAMPWGGGTSGDGEHPIYTGWGGAQADATPFGQSIRIKGKAYRSGIGIQSNSRLEVRNAGYDRFNALVGVDDSTHDRDSQVNFLVYGDGRLLGSSGPMGFGQAPKPLSFDIKGFKIIELVARTNGASSLPLTVSWAEARFEK